jgi:hypothetical protein
LYNQFCKWKVFHEQSRKITPALHRVSLRVKTETSVRTRLVRAMDKGFLEAVVQLPLAGEIEAL